MRPKRLISLIGLIALAQFSRAEISTGASQAVQPLNEGVPEVVVIRLQSLLAKNLPAAEWDTLAIQLAEAFVESKQPADALRLLDDSRLRNVVAAQFWRAQALAAVGRAEEALIYYERANATDDSALRPRAIFGQAETLRALGRTAEAIQKYSALFRDPTWGTRAQLHAAELYLDQSDAANARRILDKLQLKSATEKKQRRFLRGRLELTLHRPDRAIASFEAILKRPSGATHPLILATLFQIADANVRLGTPEAGAEVLQDFIEHHPNEIDLPRIFAKLDELYRTQKRPSRTELENWVRAPEQPRRALAQWYLARLELRVGRRERALELLGAMRRSQLKWPDLVPALLEFAELQSADGHFDEALATVNEARQPGSPPAMLDRINLLAGQVEYQAHHLSNAAQIFEEIAHAQSNLSGIATFNAALSWLQVGDRERFAADTRELGQKTGGPAAQPELQLDTGLLQAARGDKDAATTLQTFLHNYPQDPRASEAWVALAELAFHASPPRLADARKLLGNMANPTPAAEQRRDYLTIWLEDAAGANDARVIELAKGFLQRYPASPSAPELRMKLAEVYYRTHDFPNARTEFERLAEQNPNSEWAEKALFFAAESCMSSMGGDSLEQALRLFDRLVQRNGELKWPARNEQASIERKMGKPSDAIVLYDEVLKGDARPADKREALCGKADVFFEMGTADPKNYLRAADLYDQLAADTEGAAHWRKQALFKKGVCLEKASNRPAALATFYGVLEESAGTSGPDQLFWLYKAGFSAGRILEDDAKWQSAVVVYEKLAAIGGARSDEARQRLDRLRLEHFLWEE